MSRRGGLGRGLAALIPPGDDDNEATLREVAVSSVTPNPRQPRASFDPDELEGLATSIRDVGLLQPIVVRPAAETDGFELIAGERRLRAAKLAGLTTIPAIVRHSDDDALLKESLIENIHRVELNPLEEAAAYQQLLEDFELTQEELADRLGKSRPTISNALRLLSLAPKVQRRVAAGVLTRGHAKALLAVDDREEQERLAEKVIAEGMTVRATEEMVRLRVMGETAEPPGSPDKTGSSGGGGDTSRTRPQPPGLTELQRDLSDRLRARVRIKMGARSGKLEIRLGSVDDLERVVGVITRGLRGRGPGG